MGQLSGPSLTYTSQLLGIIVLIKLYRQDKENFSLSLFFFKSKLAVAECHLLFVL